MKLVWTYDGQILYKDNIDEQNIKIYYELNFEALTVTINMGRKIRLYKYYCLNLLLLSLTGFENRIFIHGKFRTFGNAPLILKIIGKTLLMILLFRNLLFLFIHSKLLLLKILLFKKNNFC